MKTRIRNLSEIATQEAQTVEQPEVIDAEVVDKVSDEEIVAILIEDVSEELATVDEIPEDLKHIPEPPAPIVDEEYLDEFQKREAYYASRYGDGITDQEELPTEKVHDEPEHIIGKMAQAVNVEVLHEIDKDYALDGNGAIEANYSAPVDAEEEGPDDHAREYAQQVLESDLYDRGEEFVNPFEGNEKAEVNNLLLNITSGLPLEHLTEREKELLIRYDRLTSAEEIAAAVGGEVDASEEELPEETEEEAYEREQDELEEEQDIAEEQQAEKDRATLIKEINDFYTLLDMPTMGRNFDLMSMTDLKDHLYLLQKNNGGSFNVAAMLQNIEMQYDKYLKSDTLKMRMGLIEQKGTDFIRIAQKMRQIIGNDFVINNTRSTEYHSMLKSAVAFISVLHEKISTIGNQLGLRLPIEEFRFRGESIPIVEGMPADPRVAMYVLDVLMAHIDKFTSQLDLNNKQLLRQELEIKTLKAREKHLMAQLDEAGKYTKKLVEDAEYFKAQNSHWIIKDDKGRYLRQIDESVKITHTSQLDLRGDEYTALQFMSKTGANTWAQRLMGTRRFRNYNLIVFRVSVVKEL